MPSWHVSTTVRILFFSSEFQFFVYLLKYVFLIHLEIFMVLFHVVIEIFGIKIAVSFNLALGCVFVGHANNATTAPPWWTFRGSMNYLN